MSELATNYVYELGYSFTKPKYRTTGISIKLHCKLFALINQPLFATVREDNRVANIGLSRLGFVQLGQSYQTYQSGRGKYNIRLMGII